MIRLKDTRHPNTAAFLNSAIAVAEYYGFKSLEETIPMRESRSGEADRRLSKKNESEIIFSRREERPLAVAARRCAIRARGTSQAMLAWRVNRSSVKERSSIPSLSLELHVVGNTSAITEALLIIVTDAIAQEAGISRRILSINNIGSFESSSRYVRDVGLYLRKHIESISQTLRPRAAVDPLGTLIQLIERGHPGVARAPQPMEYLTEDERRRFWEILEYLETFGIQYELSPHILGSRDCWAHSLFEISTVDEETQVRVPLAFGGRYDPLASRFARAPLHSAMISINCEIRGRIPAQSGPKSKRERPTPPTIYFAHLGPEARRRSLSIMETLRKEDIPVHQGLLFERIGEQMAVARGFGTPYILIMGHKEAVEGTILVREVATNSQEAIPLPELTNYLRRHHMGVLK